MILCSNTSIWWTSNGPYTPGSAFKTCPNDPTIWEVFILGGRRIFLLRICPEMISMLCKIQWLVLNPCWHWAHSDVKRSSIYICFLSGGHQGNNSSSQWLDVISIWGRQIAISCSTYNGDETVETIQWKHTMETSSSFWIILIPFHPKKGRGVRRNYIMVATFSRIFPCILQQSWTWSWLCRLSWNYVPVTVTVAPPLSFLFPFLPSCLPRPLHGSSIIMRRGRISAVWSSSWFATPHPPSWSSDWFAGTQDAADSQAGPLIVMTPACPMIKVPW